ncbi:MAG: preprotein translocase subunit SecY [Methanobrevibacter sp.]|jgi:preprotein translocase subunit SecY|nr:preprotein translocase subunit SecY [Candidatus Methanovirga basalitermitum]
MFLEKFKPLFSLIPQVKAPIHRQGFKDKIKWTAIVLVLYFFLCQIPLYGLSSTAIDQFANLRAVLAGNFQSIMTLGIGPIVTSSIVLQVLVGTKMINLDLSKHEHKSLFQSTQKILAILITIFEAVVLVSMGNLPPINPSYEWIMIVQLVVGAILILYLDEVISKWGFGSGVGLFIAAGVSQEIVIRSLNFLPTAASPGQMPGMIPGFIQSIISGSPDPSKLLPLLATIVVFLIAVYGESMRVEIPISHGQMRGHGRIRGNVGKYPLKFIYASNMPVILTSALLVNVTLMANVFQKIGFPILGHVNTGKPVDGIVLYLTTPRFDVLSTNPLRVLVYGIFFMAFCIIFSILWVEIGGLGADKIAEQLHSSGIQVPGFRSSKTQLKKMLKKYVPALTVLGGAFVGLLAFGADLTNAAGGGTGVLLTVGIVYKLYEEIAQEQLMDMHPMLKRFLE